MNFIIDIAYPNIEQFTKSFFKFICQSLFFIHGLIFFVKMELKKLNEILYAKKGKLLCLANFRLKCCRTVVYRPHFCPFVSDF